MDFKDVPVGRKFKLKDVIYTKIPPEKVSCCKSNNALNHSNNTKTSIKLVENVELIEE